MKARKNTKAPGSTGAAKATTGARWEYQLVRPLDRKGLADDAWAEKYGGELSERGAQGWELCAQTPSGHLVFKRSK